MITYPAIPLPEQGFTGDVSVPVVRTDVTNGLVTQVPRYSARLKTYSASWTFTAAEFTIFETWFSDELIGGVLVFGMPGVGDGSIGLQPFRFAGGTFQSTVDGAMNYKVTATLELLASGNAPANRTPPLAPWFRLGIDPQPSQELSVSHRNARLTVRPGTASITTLRIYPPTDPTQYLYFGINNQGLGDTLITSVDVDPLPGETVFPFPNLPQAESGFVDSGERRVARLEMDGGHPRQWVEWDTTRKVYSASWVFDITQLKTFQDFYFITLKSGTRPFNITLPLLGTLQEHRVQFVAGSYGEDYIEGGYWRVKAQLEQSISQTVSPPEWKPWGFYYTPGVDVYVNRKITSGDAYKMFNVFPVAGQTISLHIYSQTLEFGVTVKGLGNVLITRGPFILNVGSFAEAVTNSFPISKLQLVDILKNIGTIGSEAIPVTFPIASLGILSVVKPLGTIGSEAVPVTFGKSLLEIKTVLEDLGAVGNETVSTSFPKSTLTLDIP